MEENATLELKSFGRVNGYELCAYLHFGNRGPVCTSLNRWRYLENGKSIFPQEDECGKGICLHYRESMDRREDSSFIMMEPEELLNSMAVEEI